MLYKFSMYCIVLLTQYATDYNYNYNYCDYDYDNNDNDDDDDNLL